MASSGTPRHSKKDRTAVTIEHAPESVTEADQNLDAIDRGAESPSAEAAVTGSGTESADGERETPARPSPPPALRLPALGAGLAGGALALLGGAALQWGGILPTFGSSSEISALRQEITVLAGKSSTSALDPTVIDGLKSGQAALIQNTEALAADLTAARQAQQSLTSEVAALKSSGTSAEGDPAALAEKLMALEAKLNALQRAGASGNIAAMQAQIAALEIRAGASSGASNVAQAIAAAGLKAAIDRGGSFANELETFATVSPASPELEQLKNLASSGVPSKAELSAEFGIVADAMLTAAQVVDPSAGLFQRLTASAKSLVRSRPVGSVAGDTPEALVARMEVAVSKGDLDAALVEAAKLPDSARAAGIDYINRLTARRETDALVTKALTSALSATGAPK